MTYDELKAAVETARNDALRLYPVRDSSAENHIAYVKAYHKYNTVNMALFIEDAEIRTMSMFMNAGGVSLIRSEK